MRRVGCATSVASEQDKHEDRLGDPNMRVSSKPDNNSYALGCFSLNRTFSIRYLTFGLSALIMSSTSKACIMSTDSVPPSPLPVLFALDRSWQGVLITTKSTVPHFLKMRSMWCFCISLMSWGRDDVSVLWCRLAMARAVGSSSQSMC